MEERGNDHSGGCFCGKALASQWLPPLMKERTTQLDAETGTLVIFAVHSLQTVASGRISRKRHSKGFTRQKGRCLQALGAIPLRAGRLWAAAPHRREAMAPARSPASLHPWSHTRSLVGHA